LLRISCSGSNPALSAEFPVFLALSFVTDDSVTIRKGATGNAGKGSICSSVRSRLWVGTHFVIEPPVAGTVHSTTFEGTVTEDDASP
jgi:hypothetical protein